ncbi:hypothetical protein [Nocardia mangyaensis]|uniref:hypothetical protein n=1 Tax=Nocardia mangyaensis TaxID=2213200 RepID=UPI0026750431|nr:hypothetical protein [Nocardia mangyaensis]MDO3651183.1 hypothetical protein [Nocardia mangyaensis]
MNHENELDDPFIARYADRIDDETEVLWRADFARAQDYYERGYDEDAALLPEARAIDALWSTDPEVGPQWNELTEIHDAWIQAPEAMKRAHEVFMPGGLQPPDMNDTRWSSHMQAREMTGHGAWPGFEPTHSMSSNERHEPMTETTDRNDMADEVTTESDTEQLMRSDFTHWASIGDGRDPEDYDPADDLDRDEYASTWNNHGDDNWFDAWSTLSEAYSRYQLDGVEAADARRAELGDTLHPVEARSWDQARDLTVNGIARDDLGLVTTQYTDRLTYEQADEIRAAQPTTADRARQLQAERAADDQATWFEFDSAAAYRHNIDGHLSSDASRNCPANPVPEFSGVAERTSALAASSGNALADVLARQTERDGMER